MDSHWIKTNQTTKMSYNWSAIRGAVSGKSKNFFGPETAIRRNSLSFIIDTKRYLETGLQNRPETFQEFRETHAI